MHSVFKCLLCEVGLFLYDPHDDDLIPCKTGWHLLQSGGHLTVWGCRVILETCSIACTQVFKCLLCEVGLFLYDPHDDDLIPCSQAGISFKVGDILQVMIVETKTCSIASTQWSSVYYVRYYLFHTTLMMMIWLPVHSFCISFKVGDIITGEVVETKTCSIACTQCSSVLSSSWGRAVSITTLMMMIWLPCIIRPASSSSSAGGHLTGEVVPRVTKHVVLHALSVQVFTMWGRAVSIRPGHEWWPDTLFTGWQSSSNEWGTSYRWGCTRLKRDVVLHALRTSSVYYVR